MIELIKFHLKLRKLEKQRTKTRESFNREKKIEKDPEKVQRLISESIFEDDMIEEEIGIIQTDNLRKRARRRFVPIPDYKDEEMWKRCRIVDNRRILTYTGISTLKVALRKDIKERLDLILPFIALLTGLIGAITGLCAILIR